MAHMVCIIPHSLLDLRPGGMFLLSLVLNLPPHTASFSLMLSLKLLDCKSIALGVKSILDSTVFALYLRSLSRI